MSKQLSNTHTQYEDYTDCLVLEYMNSSSTLYVYYDHYESAYILRGKINGIFLSIKCNEKKQVLKLINTIHEQDDGEVLETLCLKNYKSLSYESSQIDFDDLYNVTYEQTQLFFICGEVLPKRIEMAEWLEMTKQFYNSY